ncbi:MAG TPA: hypothetical protein VIK65_00015 [Candidatus Limnocylindrales bacterium]
MFRRPASLRSGRIGFALLATVAVVLGACNSAPAAPALTDPKEILTKAVVSVKDLKTLEFTGSFTGSVTAPQLGAIDLSTVKMTGAVDIPSKKAKFSLDAPSLLGTKLDALVIDQTAYYKVAGPLAISLHAAADKYTKIPIPAGSADPVSQVTDLATLTANTQAQLDKLPEAPVKQADEKCGDQDCYHVTIKMTAADLKTLDATSTLDGDLSVDVWTRKSDYRPAKLSMSATTSQLGTFGVLLDLRYDVSVSVDAPSADQVVGP